MATGKLGIDEGTTSNLATYTFTEDAVTKHAGRSVIAKADGTDADIATSAKQDTGNTSLASIDGKLAAGHGTAAAAVRVELPTDGTGVIATVGAVTAIFCFTINLTLFVLIPVVPTFIVDVGFIDPWLVVMSSGLFITMPLMFTFSFGDAPIM